MHKIKARNKKFSKLADPNSTEALKAAERREQRKKSTENSSGLSKNSMYIAAFVLVVILGSSFAVFFR